MSSTLLLAIVFKDKWKSNQGVDDADDHILIGVLLAAGATLVIGICPSLACSVTERFPTACARWPSVTRVLAATLSTACLLALACFISLAVIPNLIVGSYVGLVVLIFLVRLYVCCCQPARDEEENAHWQLRRSASSREREAKQIRTIVDKSHEFLSGVTGILFIGLEGMALEGIRMAFEGMGSAKIKNDMTLQGLVIAHGAAGVLKLHVAISLLLCVIGVILMFIQMNLIPLHADAGTKKFVYVADLVMTIGTGVLLTTIMTALMGVKGFLFWTSPCIIYMLVLFGADDQGEGDQEAEDKPAAPLGLTKVTFTGFFVVSIKAISGGSPSEWSQWFLLFTASAIASGVLWRLLTHAPSKSILGKKAADEAANVASFLTHFCVAVAAVLFAVRAWETVTTNRN